MISSHGTLHRYQYDGCRCDDCRAVKASQTRRLALADPDRRYGPGFQPEDDDEWRTQAACAGLDHLFFLEAHQGNARPAKAICAVCPVRQTCLDYAITTHAYFGIWGGMTEKERKKYAAKRRREAV